jgi:hypothetical protein
LISKEQQQEYQFRLTKLKDFNEAFELVKEAVNAKFNMHRAGLSLILQRMPSNLGAYHILGSNVIVMNKLILNIIKEYKSSAEYNSYLFMVLAHEYLHSFGIVDELQVRNMTYDLCVSLFDKGHMTSKMAKEDPSSVFPEFNLLRQHIFERKFEIIENFDRTNQYYIQ